MDSKKNINNSNASHRLDPTSFTKNEAKELVGAKLVEFVENDELEKEPRMQGSIFGYMKLEDHGQKQFRYCIAIRWTDFKGAVQKDELVSKDVYQARMKFMWKDKAEVAIQDAVPNEKTNANKSVPPVKRSVRRGPRM